MPDELEPLDPETALALLRAHTWHSDTVAACLVHVSDWLSDTCQHGSAGELRSIWVTAPDGQQMTVAKLIGEERSASRRLGRAREQAQRNAVLGQWRSSLDSSS
ncbi:hypothetical protein [Candidatus Poriferisodalis sp.]|uniref:hypothetical protein n=1 Tax=Candidatus Poriferisodalis sp. TaxID=3101277 RepID=UPI003B02CFD6